MKRKSLSAAPVLLLLLTLGGLSAQEADEPIPESTLNLPVSLKALMVSMIDPAAHYLWDFAAPDRELGEGQWMAVEHVATQLAASAAMIRLGGTGEDDALWVADRGWVTFARMMQSASLSALQAAQTQDTEMLSEASARLVDSCNGCHQGFKPSLEPEGRIHDPSYEGLYRSFPGGEA